MPLLGKRGNRYVCSIQCGAGRHAFIEVELSAIPVATTMLYPLPRTRQGGEDRVEPEKLLEAVLNAAQNASVEFGVRYYLRCVGYIPNDSRHYDLHGRCVREIVGHLTRGGQFRMLDDPHQVEAD